MQSESRQNHLIVVAPAEVQSRILPILGSGSFAVQWSDNIYVATAMVFRMLQGESIQDESIKVLVWVDNMSPMQFKFFALLAETDNVHSVAVSDNNHDKLKRAVDVGVDKAMIFEALSVSQLYSPSNIDLEESETDQYSEEENISSSELDQENCGCENCGCQDVKDEMAPTDIKKEDNGQVSPGDKLKELDISLSREELDSLLSDEME